MSGYLKRLVANASGSTRPGVIRPILGSVFSPAHLSSSLEAFEETDSIRPAKDHVLPQARPEEPAPEANPSAVSAPPRQTPESISRSAPEVRLAIPILRQSADFPQLKVKAQPAANQPPASQPAEHQETGFPSDVRPAGMNDDAARAEKSIETSAKREVIETADVLPEMGKKNSFPTGHWWRRTPVARLPKQLHSFLESIRRINVTHQLDPN